MTSDAADTAKRRLPGQLAVLVYRAKDEVIRQRAEAEASFMDLYGRLGRLVGLHLKDPEQAKLEIIALCDLECQLTGDCKATGEISELLDPGGEHFQKMSAPRYMVEDEPDSKSFTLEEFVTVNGTEHVPDLTALRLDQSVMLGGGAGATTTIKRVS